MTWTQLLVGALVLLCFYSLYFYFAKTEPLCAQVKQLHEAVAAVTRALAAEQSELDSQASMHEAIVTSKDRTLKKLRERCAQLEETSRACAGRSLEPRSAIRDAEEASAVPEAIPDDQSPTQRIEEADSLRIAALGNEIRDGAAGVQIVGER